MSIDYDDNVDEDALAAKEHIEEGEELSTAERYGVTSFDLEKKQAIIDASRNYKPQSQAGVFAFASAMNALHFDEATGRLVSLEDARALAQVCDEARGLFETFITENQDILVSE